MFALYTERQAREISNTEQKFFQLQELHQKERSFKGTMTYRKTKGNDYLVRWFYQVAENGERKRVANVLGRKSDEMDLLLSNFEKGRELLKTKIRELEKDLENQAAINRQIGIGRVPELSARIIRKFQKVGIGSERMRVVGTHALYLYEMLAGVALHEDVTGTEDIDFLLDARSGLRFVVDDTLDDERLISVLRSADRSFDRSDNLYRAFNKNGFLVDFIKPQTKEPWFEDMLETKSDDLQPSPVEGQGWLVNARNISATLIDQRGHALKMSAPDPRVFAIHKLWLSGLKSRDPLKKGRDKLQATLVASLVHHHLAKQFPWQADDLKSVPKQIVDEALSTFNRQFEREDVERKKVDTVDLDALINQIERN